MGLNHSKKPNELNFKGQFLVLIDSLSNSCISPIYMALEMNSTYLFLSLLYLIEIRTRLLAHNSVLNSLNSFSKNIEFLLNKKWDSKHEMTFLLKAAELGNSQIVEFLLASDYSISLCETNKLKQNVLHLAVKLELAGQSKERNKIGSIANALANHSKKDSSLVDFLVRYEGENPRLKHMKDFQGKTPIDYDASRQISLKFCSIWEAARRDDHEALGSILDRNPQVYTVVSQSRKYLNTPLHVAIMYKSLRSAFLIIQHAKNSMKGLEHDGEKIEKLLNLKNYKGITPQQMIDYIPERRLRTKLTKIVNDEYSDINQLNQTLLNPDVSAISNLGLNKQVEKIRRKVSEHIRRKGLDLRRIFDKLDENKNGKLEGYEFESFFTVLDFDLTRDEVLLLMYNIDSNKDGFIDIDEFMRLVGE